MISSTARSLNAAEALLDHDDNLDDAYAHAAFVAVHDAVRWAFQWRAHEEDWAPDSWATTHRLRELIALARQLDAALDPAGHEIDDREDQRLLAVAIIRQQTTTGEPRDLEAIAGELGIDL